LEEGASLRLSSLPISHDIVTAAKAIESSFRAGGKLLIFGNGGSAADAQHIASEFSGRFRRDRAPLPAIALSTNSSDVTAIANDYGFEDVFSRLVRSLAKAEDVVIGISTSGNSENVLNGLAAARRVHARTIGLTGMKGKIGFFSDIIIAIQSESTSLIQELHIAIGHLLCLLVEDKLFG
jgi:D-sedoheptulose 7-phosphate isomerase